VKAKDTTRIPTESPQNLNPIPSRNDTFIRIDRDEVYDILIESKSYERDGHNYASSSARDDLTTLLRASFDSVQ
jgi:hypothetical protein